MRTMRGKYSGFNDRQTLDYLYKILFNLCLNGFLEPKDIHSQCPLEGWINLTEKGCDYLGTVVNHLNKHSELIPSVL